MTYSPVAVAVETASKRDVIYLATPYTHPSPAVREARYDAATDYAAAFWAGGYGVYSPITQTHEAAKRRALPQEWEFWAEQCRTFLGVCSRLVVLALPGWRESVGVRAELRIARELEIPCSLLRPTAKIRCSACPECILQDAPCKWTGGCVYGC